MTKKSAILGLDTSNYTTSISLINMEGKLIKEDRKLLSVKKGALGLRQSEALFQHINNLPLLTKSIKDSSLDYQIVAISSATKPRPLEDSYMPVFLASKSFGESMSNLWNIPFYEFSHQEGHIEAGLWSIDLKLKKPFLALQISGGTTEALKVIPKLNGYSIEIIGGTSDISAGQFVDRVGLSLSLPFPAGAYLEELCKNIKTNSIDIPISVKDSFVSFSGPETHVQKIIKEGIQGREKIAYSTFYYIGKALYRMLKNILKRNKLDTLLVVGGVASNSIIKEHLEINLKNDGVEVYFGNPKYCSDNAVGIGALGLESYASALL